MSRIEITKNADSRNSGARLLIAIGCAAALVLGASPDLAKASDTVGPFSISVKSKKYAKYGATGNLVSKITLSGPAIRRGRPTIACDRRYCGRPSGSSKRVRRSRLFRQRVTFSNVNWLLAPDRGFTVKVIPKSRRLLGVYAKVAPPDQLNSRFTISEVGCLKRTGRAVACPPNARLPLVTRRFPVPSPPVYQPGGELAAASLGPGRVSLFTTGGDNQLWVRNYSDSGGWTEWQILGGNLTSGPTVVRNGAGRLDVFARGAENRLVHLSFQDGVGWSNWRVVGGAISSTPSVSSWVDGRLSVFARGFSNELVHVYSNDSGSSWSPWENLGGCMTSAPTSASWAQGRVDVFWRGCTANELAQKIWSGGWSQTFNLGGVLGQAPSAITLIAGHLDVYAGAADNMIWHRFIQEPGPWSPWESMNSPVVAVPPAGVGLDSTHAQLFSRGVDGSVISSEWNSQTGWSAWTTLWK